MTFADLLDAFKGKTALVVGDLMLDEYIFGAATRISPEAPVMVVRHKRTTHVPGGAANVARNIEALGGKAVLVGVIGNDEGGSLLEQAVRAQALGDCVFIEDVDRQTTRKTRVLADHAHQVLRIDAEDDSPVGAHIENALIQVLEDRIPDCDVVIFSDYVKGALTKRVVESGIEIARRSDVPVVVNPKPKSAPFYRGATLVSLNRSEATAVAGRESPITNEEAEEATVAIREFLGVQASLITLGEGGMAAAIPQSVRAPAAQVEVADPAGAGDTVIATVALGVAACGLNEAIFSLAAEMAAAVVRHVGVAAPSSSDLERIRRIEPRPIP